MDKGTELGYGVQRDTSAVKVSHSEMRLLLSTCASLYCSHAKQIKEDLNDIE